MSWFSAQTWGLFRTYVIAYAVPGWKTRLRRLYSRFISPGMLCFDIGSHYGNRIPIWIALGARVVAIEPQPILFRFLQRRYGRHASVSLICGVVGSNDGEETLFHNTKNPSLSTIDKGWVEEAKRDPVWEKYQWDEEIKVRSFQLETLIHQYGVPDFCKIDVEGAELQVLQGLNRPVSLLSFEYLTIAKDRAIACIERIEQLGQYEFNWTYSEFSKLLSPTWLDSESMKEAVLQMGKGTYSGDIYARLC